MKKTTLIKDRKLMNRMMSTKFKLLILTLTVIVWAKAIANWRIWVCKK